LDGGSARSKATTYTQNNTKSINAHNTDIHALNGIRTHDPSVRAGLRLRGHSDHKKLESNFLNIIVVTSYSVTYIYLRVYLLMLDLVPLQSFVAAWPSSVIYGARTDVDVRVVLLHAYFKY
jgi:hypothetical protein